MKKQILPIVFVLSTLTVACGGSNSTSTPVVPVTPVENAIAGYLYTTTNGTGSNKIIQLARHNDGSLSDEVVYDTNSAGGANVAAGGGAVGDFDTQSALRIIDGYLLTVNAGGHDISVFEVDKSNGALTFVENVGSGGERPVSISFTPKVTDGVESTTDYWVVVGNQWNNPNVQKSGLDILRYPDADGVPFLYDSDGEAIDLTTEHASDAQRNITLFSFDSAIGVLTKERSLDTYVRENGGPTTVSFSDDGDKLAVSTWGVAHFATDAPDINEQHPSRVYVYDFNDTSGSASNERYFEEAGIAGSIGMNWAKDSDSVLHVSNFNLTSEKRAAGNSLTILTDDGDSVLKSDNRSTGNGGIDEACWTLLNPAGDRLYVSSFGANVISSFSLNADGSIKESLGVTERGDNPPAGDTKDMYVTKDNKYLYNIGAFQTFSISSFAVTESGLTYQSNYVYEETKAAVGNAGTYNFLGLDGFSK